MKVFFDYNFILFLYAYLRQADLSIDRSRWGLWMEFKLYYQQNINPTDVRDYILSHGNITLEDGIQESSHVTVFTKLCYRVFNLFSKKTSLTKNDCALACKYLGELDNYIHSDSQVFPPDIEKLRVNISKFYTQSLQYKIKRKDLKRAVSIEHFLQSHQLKVYPLKDFSNGFFTSEK